MPIADKMVAMAEKFALVQDMFEAGARLRADHGADKVFDFSLGNPDVPAPSEFKTTLKALVGIQDNSQGAGKRHEPYAWVYVQPGLPPCPPSRGRLSL